MEFAGVLLLEIFTFHEHISFSHFCCHLHPLGARYLVKKNEFDKGSYEINNPGLAWIDSVSTRFQTKKKNSQKFNRNQTVYQFCSFVSSLRSLDVDAKSHDVLLIKSGRQNVINELLIFVCCAKILGDVLWRERDVSERPWLLIFDEISLSTNLTFLLRDGNLDQGSASLQRITTAPDTIVRGEVLHCGVIVWNWPKMLRFPWTNSNSGHYEELPLDIPQL